MSKVEVKQERYFFLGWDGGSIVARPGNTLYLTVPKEVHLEMVKRGIDLKNNRRGIDKKVNLNPVGEELQLIYTFTKRENP